MVAEVDPARRPQLPARTRAWWAKLGLDLLLAMHLCSLAILILLLGPEGRQVAPLAGGAFVSLLGLACLYARWLLPGLTWRQVLLVVALRELGWLVLGGLVFASILLVRWLA